MNKNEVKAAIKKYGKTAYVATKAIPIKKQWDPIKKELSHLLSTEPPKSLFETPLSLIGGLSHRPIEAEWPVFDNKFMLPILQLTSHGLPLFKSLFGSEDKIVSIYTPQDSNFYHTDKYPLLIQEYPLEQLSGVLIPKHIPQEKQLYVIKWKKVIDYPQTDLFSLFLPDDLAEIIIHEWSEEYGEDYYDEHFPTALGTKIGGYPWCIQGEPGPWDVNPYKEKQSVPTDWDFIMQIHPADFEKLGGGMLNVFRHKQTGEWFCDFQCT
jgi:hypothetical protein